MTEVEVVKVVKDSFISGCLRALPFAPRGRRIVDETLRDWDVESSGAMSLQRRMTTGLRGLAAIIRALAAAVALDLAHAPLPWLLDRLALFAILPAVLMVLIRVSLGPGETSLTVTQTLSLGILWVPAQLQSLLPFACFVAVAWPNRRRLEAVIGTAIVASMATLATVVWLTPAAFAATDQYWWAIRRLSDPDAHFVRFVDSWSPTGLIQKAWAEGAVIGRLPYVVGLAVLAGVAVIAGSRTRVSDGWFARLRLAGVIPVGLGALSFLSASGSFRRYEFSIVFEPFFLWMFYGASAIGLLIALRRWPTRTLVTSAGCVLVAFALLPSDWVFLYEVFAGGYSPWIIASIALFLTRRHDNAASRPEVGLPSWPTVGIDPRETTDPHDTQLFGIVSSLRTIEPRTPN